MQTSSSGEWAQCLLTREANKVTLVGGVWHRKGEPIVWQEAPQALAVVAPVAAVKPKFTAKPVGHSGTSLSSRASSATSSTTSPPTAWVKPAGLPGRC